MAELAASIIFGVSEECISVLALAFTDEESQKSGRKGWMGIGRMSLRYITVVEKAFQKETSLGAEVFPQAITSGN